MKGDTITTALPILVFGAIILFLLIGLRRSGHRLLPPIVAGLAGFALMTLWVLPQGPALSTFGHWETQGSGPSKYVEGYAFSIPLLALQAAAYLATGFMAGALARWSGALNGLVAAFVPFVLCSQQFLAPMMSMLKSRAWSWSSQETELDFRLMASFMVIWLVLGAISALGGVVGQSVGRGAEMLARGSLDRDPAPDPGPPACPRCGAIIPDGEGIRYCWACGATLVPTS